ncbi:MAG: DUF1127 domain-containing protein [Pseudomonadota bacterium]
MAAIDYRPAAKGGFSLPALLGSVAAWYDRRATRKALSALTARELDDIGLNRGDIETLVSRDLIR